MNIRKIVRSISFAPLFVALCAHAQIVGTTKGDFGVEQGSARYVLQIDVPPGIAGMEPEISLTYNSLNGSNGYLGVGWSIGGLSAITRCSQTLANEGSNFNPGVNYTSNDRFCLDGKRLVVVNGKRYGSDGAEYRTQINTYSKIISRGNYGGGPRYFDVYTKDGLHYVYGAESNSFVYTAPGRAMKAWKLDRIIDTYGNTIRFVYSQNHQQGYHRLDAIVYADNKIEFVYEGRSDTTTGYHGGYPNAIKHRLKEITVMQDGVPIRRYRIAYTQEDEGLRRSLVSSITELTQEGGLKPLYLGYQKSKASFTSNGKSFFGTSDKTYFIDLDGDGISDVIRANSKGLYLYKGSGNGDFSYRNHIATGNLFRIQFGDFNGDGLIDIFYMRYPDTPAYRLNSGNFSLSSEKLLLYNPQYDDYSGESHQNGFFYVADVNQDGIGDVIWLKKAWDNTPWRRVGSLSVHVYFFKADGTFYRRDGGVSFHASSFALPTKPEDIKLGDFNGDGIPDLYIHFGNTNDRIYYANPKGVFRYGMQVPIIRNRSDHIKIVDLNGDGLSDIYLYTESDRYGAKDTLFINKGNDTFFSKQRYAIGSPSYTKFADINGDGLVDIYAIKDTCEQGYMVFDCFNKDKSPGGKDKIILNKGNAQFGYVSAEIPIPLEPHQIDFADINGDGLVDIIEKSGAKKIRINTAKRPLLTSIKNHTDQEIYITYKLMTDRTVHFNYSIHSGRNRYSFNNSAYGNIELSTPAPLVYKVRTYNGVGGYNTMRYRYFGYIVNRIYGSQGFRAIYAFDDTSKTYSGTFYRQIDGKNGQNRQFTGLPYFAFEGRPFSSSWGNWLTQTNLTYKDASKRKGVFEPYNYTNTRHIKEPGTWRALKIIHQQKTLSTDGYGNVLETIVEISDMVRNEGYFTITENEYRAENPQKWHIGRLTKSRITKVATGTTSRSSVATFAYNDKGVLSRESAHVGTSLQINKSYTYDNYGNKIKEVVTGTTIPTATTTFIYDAKKKFLVRTIDPVGLSTYFAHDPRFGTVTMRKDANGATTRYRYDALGRKIEQTHPDGSKSIWKYEWGKNHIGASYALYSVAIREAGKPFRRIYYDTLGREVGGYTYAMSQDSRSDLSSRAIRWYKYYNAKGELISETDPHYSNESKVVTTYTYDSYGRKTAITRTGVGKYTLTYNGFTKILTDPMGRKKLTITNALDQAVQVTDAYGSSAASTIRYSYDASGNLIKTTDSHGNTITMRYDIANNKISMYDPDKGRWNYRYDGLGRILQQWDGDNATKSKHFSWNSYDAAGRLEERVEVDFSYYSSYNSRRYTYGNASAPKGSKGKLIEVYASSKLANKDWKAEKKTYRYDSIGRVIREDTYIWGRGNYTTYTAYDRFSRVASVTYPNGYKIYYGYKDGFLEHIRDAKGKVLYRIKSLSSASEIQSALYGNGVTQNIYYDRLRRIQAITVQNPGRYGNIQSIHYTHDQAGNTKERTISFGTHTIRDTFAYDAMDRIVCYQTQMNNWAGTSKTVTLRYDRLGNITYKSDVGHYRYNSSKPHAVTQAGARVYRYDSVGNVIYRNGDRIVYNPLGKAAKITDASGAKEVRFYYGVGGNRFMKYSSQKGYTYYIGKRYEEQVEGYQEKQICYIFVGSKRIAQHVEIKNTYYNPSNPKYHKASYNRYFHHDALGSITAVTDDRGNAVSYRYFDPFGKVRNVSVQKNRIIPVNLLSETARAYTDHEHVDEFSDLIHMNARLYDSAIGRFLSADTIIQDAHDTQAYNRYTYVRNNPLKYTDPSGHSWLSGLWNAIKSVAIPIITAVAAVYTAGAVLGAMGFSATAAATAGYANAFSFAMASGSAGATALLASGAAAGFTAGAVGALLNGGSLSQALRAGAQGAFFGAIGAGFAGAIGGLPLSGNLGKLVRASLHGITRAAIAKAQGGRYSGGFWSAFASSAMSPLIANAGNPQMRVTMALVVGGTASSLGGGKFANGAVSAAFVAMYNEMGHEAPKRKYLKSLSVRQIDQVSKFERFVQKMDLKTFNSYFKVNASSDLEMRIYKRQIHKQFVPIIVDSAFEMTTQGIEDIAGVRSSFAPVKAMYHIVAPGGKIGFEFIEGTVTLRGIYEID